MGLEGVERLAAAQAATNHTLTPGELRTTLTELLGLPEIGRTVIGARMFGRGPNASVDIALSGDETLMFERFSDVAKPTVLATYMASYGIAMSFKQADAIRVAALVSQLAEHHTVDTADAMAREWGYEYLRLATVQEVNMDDQLGRWQAFSALQRVEPGRDSNEDRSPAGLAAAGLVLQDHESGVRFVRCGWFLGYVRREVGSLHSPQQLAQLMQRVGWDRRGVTGRIKATSPDGCRTLQWSFYTVAKEWGR